MSICTAFLTSIAAAGVCFQLRHYNRGPLDEAWACDCRLWLRLQARRRHACGQALACAGNVECCMPAACQHVSVRQCGTQAVLTLQGAVVCSIPEGAEARSSELELSQPPSSCDECSLHSHCGACEKEACLLWRRPQRPSAVWRLHCRCPAALRAVLCPLPGPAGSAAAATPQP